MNQGLVLFSSNSTRRYSEDILSVLALANGMRYHFRYDGKYLPAPVLEAIANGNAEGTRILVAFRGAAKGAAGGLGKFIVPVRWAKIVSVKKVSDFYVIEFSVGGYPTINQRDAVATSSTKIETRGLEYLKTLPENLRQLPVHVGLPSYLDVREEITNSAWISVLSELSKHDTFNNVHFFRILQLVGSKNQEPILPKLEGTFSLSEKSYANLELEYYCDGYSGNHTNLEVNADQSNIRIASPKSIEVRSRYDATSVLFETLAVSGNVRTFIDLRSGTSESNSLTMSAVIPIVIGRNYANAIWSSILGGLAACLVAAPGILGDKSQLSYRLALALLGAFLVAYLAGRKAK